MQQKQRSPDEREARPGPGQDRAMVDVLVVEDDDDVRSSVADILRLAGFTVLEAEDGLVALEVLGTTDVAVMVLDIKMPRLDGFGLLDALERPPPVILISASDPDEDPRRVAASIYWYLQKPLHPERLVEAVTEVVRHKRG